MWLVIDFSKIIYVAERMIILSIEETLMKQWAI